MLTLCGPASAIVARLAAVVASSLVLPAQAADLPKVRIEYAGDLVGVFGGAVVIDAVGATRHGGDLRAFDARDGHPLGGATELASALGSHPPYRWLRAVGDVLMGETPSTDGGMTFFEPRAKAVRFKVGSAAMAYLRTYPPVASRLLAVASQPQDGAVILGVADSRGECGVAIEAREVRSGKVRWRWSPPGPCWAVDLAMGGDRVFVHTGPSVQALSLAAGKSLWRSPSHCGDSTCFAELATDGQDVGLTIGGHTLTIFAASTGAVTRDVAVDLPQAGRLVVRDRRACLAATSRTRAPETTVSCVGTDGQHRWTQKLAGGLVDLNLDGGTLYVGGGGAVRAFDAASGQTRWTFGGDRVAMARLEDGVRVVLGTDGAGALILPAGVAPEPPRDVTLTGAVIVRPSFDGAATPPARTIAVQATGTSVQPGNDGRYQVALRLNGGRLKIVACGCKVCSTPAYVTLDERTTYRKDLSFDDHCRD
jgi:hypothetical protein